LLPISKAAFPLELLIGFVFFYRDIFCLWLITAFGRVTKPLLALVAHFSLFSNLF
jgi:hypothetical protein